MTTLSTLLTLARGVLAAVTCLASLALLVALLTGRVHLAAEPRPRPRPRRRRAPAPTFDPADPKTWDTLPAGYTWRPAPSGDDCGCAGRMHHLYSADGTDLSAAIVARRGQVSRAH